MMKMLMMSKRGVWQRWRTVTTVAASLALALLTYVAWWSQVDVNSVKAPIPAAQTDVEEVRQLLLRGVDDERGTWPCLNSSRCMLTASELATTSAARRSVYSRTGLDCLAMFHGHATEIEAARKLMDTAQSESTTPDVDLGALAANCDTFRRSRGYFSQPLSRVEADFPIAFSILAYDNIPQVERLLRAIYMPQNVYCIHIDSKAPAQVHKLATAITNCFDNVFIASRLESVYWGHISIVYAEMNCLHDLLRYKWKYFINLSGFMFPAHSNRELVEILRLYDGANDIEGSFTRSDHFWLRMRNLVSWHYSETFGMNIFTLYPKSKAAYNVTIYKGSNQAALTRAFVLYFLYSPQSRNLLSWFADTLAPDEYIWPTLNHNPQLHAPGSYKGLKSLPPLIDGLINDVLPESISRTHF